MAPGQLRAAPSAVNSYHLANELFLSNPVMVLRIGQVLD